jgi:DNA polymerase eta
VQPLRAYDIHKQYQFLYDAEKASIDEAFIDFTFAVREIILERFPYLAQVPDDAQNGIDTPLPTPPPISWDGLGAVVPIALAPDSSEDHPESSTAGEEVHDEVDEVTTWHDIALSIAAELMESIRDEVRTKLGYTTSAVSLVLL